MHTVCGGIYYQSAPYWQMRGLTCDDIEDGAAAYELKKALRWSNEINQEWTQRADNCHKCEGNDCLEQQDTSVCDAVEHTCINQRIQLAPMTNNLRTKFMHLSISFAQREMNLKSLKLLLR